MAQVINTNIQSLIAQKNLFKSGSSLSTSIERLSSGLRINSARDDAAGLAISERMSAQIRGMEVAKRNANDGISALQVADGALSSLGDNLQRMRELAVQSSNGTLSESDRKNLNLEFQQLSEEIARVAGDVQFNGVDLLKGDGMGGPKQFELQIGYDSSSQLNINFENIDSEIVDFRRDGDALNGATALTGKASTNDLTLADLGGGTANLTQGTAGATTNVTVGDLTLQFEYTGTADSFDVYELNADGSQGAKIGTVTAATTPADVTLNELGVATQQASNGRAYIQLGSQEFELETDANNTTFTNAYKTTDIAGANGSKAQLSLDKIDTLLDTVNQQRATLGAGINRLDAVINNLETSVVNLSAARGRIIDADFARETANLTRTQILQQAGTAMLAQANQLPTNVLSLLG